MSGDGTLPSPKGKLPEMTAAERRLWMASHRAPENMCLVTVEEMGIMRASFDAIRRECELWRKIGKKYLSADLPESFEPALRLYFKQREQLEAKVKELTTPPVLVKAEPGKIQEP